MKRNTVRLTESQLHRVIKESVKRVLREGIRKKYYGRVSHDGNGMVGGRYGSYETDAVAEIRFDSLLNNIGINLDDERFEVYLDEFYEAFGDDCIPINATIQASFDESVGMPDWYYELDDVDDISDCTEFTDALEKCQSISPEEKSRIIEAFKVEIENLTVNDFNFD